MFGFSAGFFFVFILLPLGGIIRVVYWFIDAGRLVKWALLVASAPDPDEHDTTGAERPDAP